MLRLASFFYDQRSSTKYDSFSYKHIARQRIFISYLVIVCNDLPVHKCVLFFSRRWPCHCTTWVVRTLDCRVILDTWSFSVGSVSTQQPLVHAGSWQQSLYNHRQQSSLAGSSWNNALWSSTCMRFIIHIALSFRSDTDACHNQSLKCVPISWQSSK